MTGLTQMLATGWPLALVGFILGALTGVLISRGSRKSDEERPMLKPGEDAVEVLAAELKAAKELLAAEEAEAGAAAETLTALDEAIKRANGRLKLMAKAVKKAR